MSKEQKFHELIQKQDSKEKESLWNKIEQQTASEQVDIGGGVLAKKHILSNRNQILICATALLAMIVGIILICKFVSPQSNDDSFRYCEFGDFYTVDSDESIKDYATANNKDLLYFEWYEESEYYVDSQIKLIATDEVICLGEELVDENGVYISQYVTDTKTQIDFLEAYKTFCIEKTTIKAVEVSYGSSDDDTYAYFNNGKNIYYLKLNDFSDNEYMLELINDLIK